MVELLVVIAVLLILAGMLLAVLAQSRARAKRTQCTNQLKQVNVGCVMYTSDNDDHFPTGYYLDGSLTSYSYDAKSAEPLPSPRVAMGLGLIYANGYVTGPTMYHCPVQDTSSASTFPSQCMNRESPNGFGMNWFDITTADRIIIGYQYRGPSYVKERNRNLTVSAGGDSFALVTDVLDYRFGLDYTHKNGYNVGYLDGHVSWFPDRGTIENLAPGQVLDGLSNSDKDEAAFEYIGAHY
jgi:prepilin-type processing-associated H-X9-DG protein